MNEVPIYRKDVPESWLKCWLFTVFKISWSAWKEPLVTPGASAVAQKDKSGLPLPRSHGSHPGDFLTCQKVLSCGTCFGFQPSGLFLLHLWPLWLREVKGSRGRTADTWMKVGGGSTWQVINGHTSTGICVITSVKSNRMIFERFCLQLTVKWVN